MLNLLMKLYVSAVRLNILCQGPWLGAWAHLFRLAPPPRNLLPLRYSPAADRGAGRLCGLPSTEALAHGRVLLARTTDSGDNTPQMTDQPLRNSTFSCAGSLSPPPSGEQIITTNPVPLNTGFRPLLKCPSTAGLQISAALQNGTD